MRSYPYKKRRHLPTTWIKPLIYTAFIGIAGGGQAIYNAVTEDSFEATVKTLTVKPSKGSGYLVMTDKEVLENDDAWLKGKFNSSDMQNSLQVGHTYNFETVGKRIPLFSTYKNMGLP